MPSGPSPETEQNTPNVTSSTEKETARQILKKKKSYLHRIFVASRNTEGGKKKRYISFKSNISNLYMHLGGVRGHWPHAPPSRCRCQGWAAAVHKWQNGVKYRRKQKSSLFLSDRSWRGNSKISVCKRGKSEEKSQYRLICRAYWPPSINTVFTW